MKSFLIHLFLLMTFYCVAQEEIETHYKIYDTKTKQFTTIEKIIADCSHANVLFFGEEHNDSIGHYLKNRIFRALHSKYGVNLALSMEMFESDNQLALNEYLAGLMDENRFSKDVRLWSNYKDYRPMIEFAKQNRIPVIAANPPRRYVTMVSRRGMKSLDSLSKDAKKFLPKLPYDTLSGRYREKFMDIMKGSPGSGSPNIYYSQSLWDAAMGNNIFNFWKKNKKKKIFHCVGRFHSDEKLGTVTQLKKRNPKLKILNISCFSDSTFNNPDWEKFKQLGDYIIITNPDVKKTF